MEQPPPASRGKVPGLHQPGEDTVPETRHAVSCHQTEQPAIEREYKDLPPATVADDAIIEM